MDEIMIEQYRNQIAESSDCQLEARRTAVLAIAAARDAIDRKDFYRCDTELHDAIDAVRKMQRLENRIDMLECRIVNAGKEM